MADFDDLFKLPESQLSTFKQMAFKPTEFKPNIEMPDFGLSSEREIEEIQKEQEALLKEYGASPVWEFEGKLLDRPIWELPAAMKEEQRREEVQRALIHEALNVYALAAIFAPYLGPTWFAFKEDRMDDTLEKAGDSLEKAMFERLNIRPVVVVDEGEKERLFLARFELPKYGASLQFPEAALPMTYKCLGWIDFLSGFHYGCCEMLVVVGEVSTKIDDFPAKDGEDRPVPPVPDELFDEQFQDDKILHNYIWLESDNTEGLVDGVRGEPEPAGPHWFFRVNCIESQKWPYPGEFLGLGNRIFPNLPWTLGKSPGFHPFLFSGMFMDTVFITSAEVMAVKPVDEGYVKVKVKWREQELWVYPSDFAEYEIGDRVTICKDVAAPKTSELWKDEDLWAFDEEFWRIVPLTYYGKGFGGF